MTWLGDKIRSVLFCLDEGMVAVTNEDTLEEASISEPVITFVKLVKDTPERFRLVRRGHYHGILTLDGKLYFSAYTLQDTEFNKVFYFGEGNFSGLYEGCFKTLNVNLCQYVDEVPWEAEDISWLTKAELRYLHKVFKRYEGRVDRLEVAKTKRKKANQRRQMRKLYAN